MTYSAGYEHEPRSYPSSRCKGDRLDAVRAILIGPHDDVVLNLHKGQAAPYEPFWFRTFRIMRFDVSVGGASPAAVV